MLKNSTKRVMIIGFCQAEISDTNEETIYDYAGCLYPEGYIGPSEIYLFNGEQIDKISAFGYQDDEQFAFKATADEVHKGIREVKAQSDLEPETETN